MKTVTEMQLQIRNMSTQLDILATELEQFGKTDRKSQKIDFESIYKIAVRNPIMDHYLQEYDISIKKSYLTMLVLLASMVKQNQENAWLLVQRIAIGVGYEESIQNLQVDAFSLSNQHLDHFTYSLVEAGVNIAFALDAILLYLICEVSDIEILSFISEILALLKCNKKQIREISEIAKSIVERDEKNGIINKAKIETLIIGYCYLKEYTKGLILNDNKGKYILYRTKIGDIYAMGEIDGKPIMWKVIGKENNKTLLLCEQKIIIEKGYDFNGKNLNEVFLQYFNNNEIANILNDRVFLLSKDEVEKYLPNRKERVFFEEWMTRDIFGKGVAGIMLEEHGYYISSDGEICEWRSDIVTNNCKGCIRPALWLNI